MKNLSQFYENTRCEYYPCHKNTDHINCLFCYCPFYAWERCPGKNEYKITKSGKRVKVCTDCNFPHKADNYDQIIKYLKMGEDEYRDFAQNEIKHDCNYEPIFYGIGVGPGDSDLITIKAANIIRNVDVLILPGKDKDNCRAYAIAVKSIPEISNKECIFMPFPMSMKEPELTQFHREVAECVESYMQDGKSVGFLTIGDVSVYSTYDYIENMVKADGYATEYISGIPSFIAAASRLGIPLAVGSEEIHIIPGSADMLGALTLPGTKIFMKSGKGLSELKAILETEEQLNNINVYAVSNCGMDNEVVTIGAENIEVEREYLTVVIVKNK